MLFYIYGIIYIVLFVLVMLFLLPDADQMRCWSHIV
jgi:hypothetical protein